MSANLRSAFLTGSGVLTDTTTGANVADTRIRAIHATGSGNYILDGTSTTPLGSTAGQKITFGVSGSTDGGLYSSTGVLLSTGLANESELSFTGIAIIYFLFS